MKNNDEQLITTIYKEFYGHKPNYTPENRSDLTIEMQAIFYILKYLGIICNYSFQYEALEDYKMPISMDLQDSLVKMINSQDKDNFFISYNLQPTIKENIKTIGKIIDKDLAKNNNYLEELRLIVSILYSKEFMIPCANDDELTEFNKCSLEELKNIYSLLSYIQNIVANKKSENFTITLPYKLGTYLKKIDSNNLYVARVETYIINEYGVYAIIQGNILDNEPKVDYEINIDRLKQDWNFIDNVTIEKEKVKKTSK